MERYTVTFEVLRDAVGELGIDVGVRPRAAGHEIRLVDHARCRSLCIPVSASFDAAVSGLCLSLALIRSVPGFVDDGMRTAAEWPELVELAWAAVAVSGTVAADPESA